MRSTKWYGWKPDSPDHRDFKYGLVLRPKELSVIPISVDLTPDMPPVQDQGQVGACTAHAAVGVLGHNMITQKRPFYWPSRLFAYYNARDIEGTASSDSGAMLRDMVGGLAEKGVCSEDLWPYVPEELTVKPSVENYAAAEVNKIRIYARLTNLNDMLHCLAAGYPFVFGFTVYDFFESDQMASTGELLIPTAEESPVGGHAVCAVGYDREKEILIVRNSWSPDWGKNGYFTMPFAYATNPDLADDFWTIRF